MTGRWPRCPPPATSRRWPSFGHDPWWLIIIKVLVIFVFLLLATLLAIWAERRIIGRMQQRPGPNRAGKFGLLQSLMDGIKLALMEDIVPRGVDKAAVRDRPGDLGRSPRSSASRSSRGARSSRSSVHQTPLQLTDLPVAVLLVLAMSSHGRVRDRAGRLVRRPRRTRCSAGCARRPR